MKREEREQDDGGENKQNDKKHFSDKPSKRNEYYVNPARDQLQSYSMRQKLFHSKFSECKNETDPIFPDRKLKMNDALFFLYDKNNKKWCFNLVTLWPKFEATNSYDIEKLYRDYGNIILTILDTKDAEFIITIKDFVMLKHDFYKYAHNIEWRPPIRF